MNKKIALIAAFAIAATSSQARPLEWVLDDNGGSVSSGGYWFTYGDEKENGINGIGGCSSTDFPPGSEESDEVTDWWQGNGGEVNYTFNTNCTYAYRFAGIGFNWFPAEGDSKLTIGQENDPTEGATLITVKYNLTKDAGVTCKIEVAADGVTAYDNYTAIMASGDQLAGKTYELGEGGDFSQSPSGWGNVVSWAEAWAASEGIKFKCEAEGPEKGAKTAKLILKSISFSGSSPILKTGSVANLSMTQNGRMVSMFVPRAASVQVINLQGALVHTQVVAPEGGLMNLSNLPSGVYMIRIPALGYANKVMLK